MGAIAGFIVAGGTTFVACAPMAAFIIISVTVGFAIDTIDKRYQLTEKLITAVEKLPTQGDRALTLAGEGLSGFLRGNGLGRGNLFPR